MESVTQLKIGNLRTEMAGLKKALRETERPIDISLNSHT
jgi:hypothetical protein